MASIACTPPLAAPGGDAGPRERARGALLGLAVGDALGAPAENLRPSEIHARWGRITGYVTERPCGTDDTEYAIFSGLLLARHGSALTPAHVEAAWHEWIADRAEGPFRGAGFSERGTLENLRRGLAAPISAQHRHAWSDGLAMRAAPFGVFAAGRPAEAARLVAIDGSVSHEGEGIYGGQAVAAGVAAAMAGASPALVIASALAVVPDDSWTARSLRRAVTVAHRGERAVRSAVVIGGYPWTDLAPEAVALAFGAYAAADGDFREAVLTAVNMGRDADTTAAVAGALSGATQGLASIPPEWASAIGPARGRCLPSMAGHHILDVAELLVPEEGGKWGAGVVVPGFLPEGLLPTPHPTEPPAVPGPASHPTAAPAPFAPAPQPAAPTALLGPASRPTERPPVPEPTSQPTETPAPFTPTLQSTEPPAALGPAAHPTATPAPFTPAPQPAEPPALLGPASRPTEPTTSDSPDSPDSPTSQPAERTPPPPPTPQPTGAPAALGPASRPTEAPVLLASAPHQTETPAPLTSAPHPTEAPAPSAPAPHPTEAPAPSASAPQAGESGGGWVEGRGARGRSPLVGAGNSGHPDSEPLS
ncbi:ADP-ribosylglycohydrolase family protein [Streptomyces sp. NPDC020362]|uniref:ADP-ribosylglycohydrolase family protein n=1 Tax=unclassified Streptomyces TaxID=2593676 RepID=UPI0033CD20DB